MKNASHAKERSVEFQGQASAGCDDARVSWSPLRRELPVGYGNTVHKLIRREIGGLSGRTPPRPDATFCAEKFRRFNLQEIFSVQTGMEISPWMRPSIVDIILANGFIFIIDSDGLCIAFHQTANASIVPYEKDGGIWYFNNLGERMISMFYNKINDSIITVSYSMPWSGYKIRAVPLESIRRKDNWGSGIEVFWSRPKKRQPLFDSCNNVAIISLYQNGHVMNNIYETKNYQHVHSIPGEINSITTRPGKMIVAHKIFCNILPIKVFSTENWTVLAEFSFPTPPLQTLQFVGLCSENILLKVKDQNVHLIDLWNYGNVTTIENSEHVGPLFSFDLFGNNVLLNLENKMVVTCNSRGVQVPLLQDPHNESKCHTVFPLNVTITRDKKFAILYSLLTVTDHPDCFNGTINICNTFSGKSIVEVNPCDNLGLIAAAHSSAQEALKHVRALAYDEEHHRIFTGDADGYIHVWST